MGKLEWWGYQAMKKFDGKFSHFDTIYDVTDRQMDRRTPVDSKDSAMHNFTR